MRRYALSLQARADLKSIAAYIARDKPSAAKRLRGVFLKQFRLLAASLQMGQSRDDLLPGLRAISVGNYVILFRAAGDGVEIVQVVHAARDLAEAFRKPGPIES